MKFEEAQLSVEQHQSAIGSEFLDKDKDKTVIVAKIFRALKKTPTGEDFPDDYDVMFYCNPIGKELPYYVSITHFNTHFELII